MVTKRTNLEASPSSKSPIVSNRTRSASRSTADYTPSSSTLASGEQRDTSPSFVFSVPGAPNPFTTSSGNEHAPISSSLFANQNESVGAPCSPNSTTPRSLRFTSSPNTSIIAGFQSAPSRVLFCTSADSQIQPTSTTPAARTQQASTSTSRPTSGENRAITPSAAVFFTNQATSNVPFTFGTQSRSGGTPLAVNNISSGTTRSASSASPTSTIWDRLGSSSAPPAEISGAPSFALSSAPFRFGEGTPTLSPPVPDRTTSETPRFTRSPPLASLFSAQRVFTPSLELGDEHNPDRPLPSIEREVSSTSSRQRTPSTTAYTPSHSTAGASVRQTSMDGNFLQQLRNLEVTSPVAPVTASSGGLPRDFDAFRLASPEAAVNSSSERDASTPSIHVTPAPLSNGRARPQWNSSDSLVDGVDALRMDHSPTSSPRHRSESRVNREKHRVENESPPDSLFYSREVQEALQNTGPIMTSIANVLTSSNLHQEPGSRVQSLLQQALSLQAFELPSSRIVGLVGDAGVGKSSLINSLLDTNLARVGNSGVACTCVVTEYHYHNRSNFIIEVDYFRLEELRRQYEELLRGYRDYHEQLLSPNATEGQLKAKIAEETFRATFGERISQRPGLLLTCPFDETIETMIGWASQQLGSRGVVDGATQGHGHFPQESFDTIDRCSSRLGKLTTEYPESEHNETVRACPWPFVRKIRVYLKAYILSRGLVITDLPGLRDRNSARQKITEDYIRQCHQILVVTRIDRAVSDQSVKEVFLLARRAKLNNIGVVCTRSDDIYAREAEKDLPAETATIEKMRRIIEDDEQKTADLTEEIYRYGPIENLSNDETRNYARLHVRLGEAREDKKRHDFELTSHIVLARNAKVSSDLQQTYRNHQTVSSLQIFCISSKTYEKHRDDPAEAAEPFLSLSGIIGLRRYCIGIVAESHLRATREYITGDIPAFLGSIQLWVDAGSGNLSAERKQQILEAVSNVQRRLDEFTSPDSRTHETAGILDTEFDNYIYKRMRQCNAQWAAGARQASEAWEAWHHATYKAFCSNFGEHQTGRMPYHCWNEEAMRSMDGDMSDAWNTFEGNLTAHLEQNEIVVHEAFGSAIQVALAAAKASNEPGSTLRTLSATLRNRKGRILHGIGNAIEDFHSALTALQTNAFSPIRSAFIGQLMEDTYHEASMKYGTGSDRGRKNLIRARFGGPELFASHRRGVRTSFRTISASLQNAILKTVDRHVALIRTDLQMLRDENGILESERNPEFRERLAREVRRARDEVERIGRVVDGRIAVADNVRREGE